MRRKAISGAAPAAARRLCGVAALLVLLPANASPDPAAAFGARESVDSIRISPDGSKLAYVGHFLEDSAARADMLRRSDQFLRASLGMQ